MTGLFRTLKAIFSILAIGFILFVIWDRWEITGEIVSKSNLKLLLCSVLLWGTSHLIVPMFSVAIFRGLSASIRYKDAFYIHTSRLPAKYLPGGIWHSVARVEGYHGHGIDKRYIALYLLIENLSTAGVTLLVGGVIVSLFIEAQSWFTTIIPWVVIASLAVLLALPWVINHNMLPVGERMVMKRYWYGIVLLCLFWGVASLAFYSFIMAMDGADLTADLLQIMGIYLFSWGVGFIALIAPQGIGVSEYVASQLLPHGMDTLVVITLLAGFRGVVLIGDMLSWLLVLLLFRGGSVAKVK